MKNGILGGITGKLGNTVCYMLNGKQVMRMRVKSTKPPTERQLLNQADMGIVARFLGQIKPLIDIGYGIEAKREKREPYNMAFSDLKKYGLKGEGADRQIDFTKVKLSEGYFPALVEPAAEWNGVELLLSWSPDCFGSAWGADRVMVLVYYPAVEGHSGTSAVCSIGEARRADGRQVVQLPLHLAGRPVEIYVFVQAANAKEVSDTQYLGRL